MAVLFAWFILAVPGFAGSHPSFSSQASPILSDFNRDNKLDQAELVSSDGTEKRIRVTLGDFSWKFLAFESGVLDRGRLVSDDVDSDGDTDLLWISLGSPRQFVLWLGDGRGNFSIATSGRQDRLQELLQSDKHSGIATDSADNEPNDVAPSPTVVAIEHRRLPHHDAFSARLQVVDLTPNVYAAFLSVVRKRGPPALLS
jgi:hypothetical protein